MRHSAIEGTRRTHLRNWHTSGGSRLCDGLGPDVALRPRGGCRDDLRCPRPGRLDRLRLLRNSKRQ
eukprot:6176130-Pleurochrysis_carterae.AAC.3